MLSLKKVEINEKDKSIGKIKVVKNIIFFKNVTVFWNNECLTLNGSPNYFVTISTMTTANVSLRSQAR